MRTKKILPRASDFFGIVGYVVLNPVGGRRAEVPQVTAWASPFSEELVQEGGGSD